MNTVLLLCVRGVSRHLATKHITVPLTKQNTRVSTSYALVLPVVF